MRTQVLLPFRVMAAGRMAARRALHGTAVGLLLAASLALPDTAAACAPWCEAYYTGIAPPDGATAPVDAPALAVKWLPSWIGVSGPGPMDGGAELVREDGGVVEIQVETDGSEGWYLVRPIESLAEGETLALRLRTPCWIPPPAEDGGVDGGMADAGINVYSDPSGWLQSAFTTGAPAALPALAGTLAVVEEDAGIAMSATGCGSCTKPIRAGVARLRFTPSAELQPWVALTRLTLLVDGNAWAIHEYGHLAVDGTVALDTEHRYDEIFSRCDADPDADPGLPPGDHSAVLQAHVAGAPADPEPLQVSFRLSCDNVGAVAPPPNPCSWYPIPDSGSQDWPDGGQDSGGGGVDGRQPAGPIAPCGCGGGWGAVLAVALAGVRGRRSMWC